MSRIGAVIYVPELQGMLEVYDGMTYAQKVTAEADVKKTAEAADPAIAFLTGWLSGWCAGSNTKTSSLDALSIKRLMKPLLQMLQLPEVVPVAKLGMGKQGGNFGA